MGLKLQFAYPLSPETDDGGEVWKRPDDMTLEDFRAAIRVLEDKGASEQAAQLRAFAQAQLGPGEEV